MSDVRKITDSRKATRDAAQLEWRQALATEEAADALEGIRQDLTVMAGQLVHVVQAIERLTQAMAARR